MFPKKYFLIIFLPLSLISLLRSQEALRFQQYMLESGISDLTINDIVQDQKGFLWIATRDGLSRFDGKNFDVYRRVNVDGKPMPGNLDAIYCDRKNLIWLGTDHGVFILSADRTGFQRLNLPDTTVFDIEEFYEDTTGLMWMAAWTKGLLAWDPSTGMTRQWKLGKNQKAIVSTILPAKNDRLWICTLSGLFEMDLASYKISPIPIEAGLEKNFPDINEIYSADTDNNGNLWLGTGAGLAVFYAERGEVTRPDWVDQFAFLKQSTITKVYVDREQNLWVGSQGYGLFGRHLITGQIYHSLHDPDNLLSLSDDYIQSIFEDRDRQMWIGTGSGLNRIPWLTGVFRHFRRGLLLSDYVRCIAVDEAGRIWVGTSQGLSILNSGGSESVHFKQLSGQTLDNINTMLPLASGEMLLGFNAGGLLRASVQMNRSGLTLQGSRPEFTFAPAKFTKQLPVTSLFIDRLDRLWIGTGDSRAFVINSRSENISGLFPTGMLLPGTMITRFAQSADGQIWVATMRGIYRFSENLELEKSFQAEDNNPGSLPFRAVESLAFDSQNRLWAATARGVALLHPGSEQFINFERSDGLPDVFCKSVLVDRQGLPWFATRFGLARAVPDSDRPKGFRFRSYQSREGLPFDEILPLSAFADRQGLLYFGGLSGMFAFNPEVIPVQSTPPEVIITAVYLFDKPLSGLETARFPHTGNTLRFDFAAPDFSGAHKMKYYYRLFPVDGEWKPAGENRSVIFAKLRPGNYTFQVLAENEDGIGSARPAVFSFSIQAAFWQTWWFQLFLAALLLWAVWLLYRYRLGQLLAVEKLRTRIASDLHDEIGASLTKISMDAQLLQAGLQRKKVDEMLDSIARNSDEAVHKLSDIVWSVDSRNDTTGNLADHIRDLAYGLFSETETAVKFDSGLSDAQRLISAELRHHLFLICKEALNNTARHAGAGTVLIRINDNGNRLFLEIEDDGCGFPPELKSSGNGLRNMRMRARRIGAELSVTGSADGTRISLSVHL